MKLRMIGMSILVAGASIAIATAGFKCDETAKKSSASCCASKSVVKTVSATTEAECTAHTAVAKKECSAAEQAECSSKKMAKKVKSSSCCASKTNAKMSAVESTSGQAEVVATTNSK
ncbi:MAG: hypothetical protein HQ472_04975 [Ignavibacteria bacterium]|nr:hypothetical protein [Ignavibacteria bacterium]